MTSPVRIDHFRHAVVTTDGDGNTFVHNRVPGEDPEALVARPRLTAWQAIDGILTGALALFLLVAAGFIGKWAMEAVTWAVSR